MHKIVSVLAKIAVLYGGEHKEEVKDGFYVAFPNGNHILVTFEPITVLGKALGGYIIYLSAAIGNDAFAEQKQSQKSNVDNHVQTRRENNLLSQLASDMVPIPGKDYAICKYEVIQALWEAVMGSNPSHFKGADLPVESFSWDECCQFIGKLNERGEIKASGCQYRLPTQEEWEFASLAGGDDKYPMAADGNHVSKQSVERIAWCAENSGDATHQVGQKEANAFGLYDVMGNVAELMYETTRKGVNYNSVVYSGGSWGDSKDGFLKIDMPMAFVSEWELGDGKNYVGIRLVRDVGDWMTAFKKNGNHRERE